MKCTTCQFLSVAYEHANVAYQESLTGIGQAADSLSARNSGSVVIEQYFYARIQSAAARQRVETAWENLKRHGAEHEHFVETAWENLRRHGDDYERLVEVGWDKSRRQPRRA